MGICRFLRTQRTKWRFWRQDRRWNRSGRKREIEAEQDLPPRPLTPEEDDLLRWILEHGSDEAKSFLPQVERIRAVRGCTCGCPTIHLEAGESALLGSSQADRIICDLLGRTAKGELVGLLLFQIAGKLDSLEIYSLDGDLKNNTPEFGLPMVETLKEFGAG